MKPPEVHRLSSQLGALQSVLAWSLAASRFKAKHEVQPHAVLKLQLSSNPADTPVLFIEADLLEDALKAYTQGLVAELEAAGVELDELVRNYLQQAMTLEQENKMGLDKE